MTLSIESRVGEGTDTIPLCNGNRLGARTESVTVHKQNHFAYETYEAVVLGLTQE